MLEITSNVSPSLARVISVYSPSWGFRASAMAAERPVKAAMPQSAASGAWLVYQAWWARKKLPRPTCTMRTGAAGPAVAGRAGQAGCWGVESVVVTA